MNHAMRLLCKICILAAFFVLAPPEVLGQTIAKGQVLDSNGEAVIGATVAEKGLSANATVTDIDGNFTLTLQKAKHILISYIGMITEELQAAEGMNVVRKVPKYLRPYMLFSPHTPNCSTSFLSVSAIRWKGSSCLAMNF